MLVSDSVIMCICDDAVTMYLVFLFLNHLVDLYSVQ